MVEVFKTNVQEAISATMLIQCLSKHFATSRVTFDLDDCDKILRIEGLEICPKKVKDLVGAAGFECAVLE